VQGGKLHGKERPPVQRGSEAMVAQHSRLHMQVAAQRSKAGPGTSIVKQSASEAAAGQLGRGVQRAVQGGGSTAECVCDPQEHKCATRHKQSASDQSINQSVNQSVNHFCACKNAKWAPTHALKTHLRARPGTDMHTHMHTHTHTHIHTQRHSRRRMCCREVGPGVIWRQPLLQARQPRPSPPAT